VVVRRLSLVPPFPDGIVTMTDFLSVCVFFVALLLFSFRNTTPHIRAWVGTASGFVIILIVWCIITSWDSDSGDSEWDEMADVVSEDELHTTGNGRIVFLEGWNDRCTIM